MKAILLLLAAVQLSFVLAVKPVYPYSEAQNLQPVNATTHRFLKGCYSRYGDFVGFGFLPYRAELHYCDNTPGAAPGDEQQLMLFHGYNLHRIIGTRLSTMSLFNPGMNQVLCENILLGKWTPPGCTWRQLMNAEQWDRNVTLGTLSNNQPVTWETMTPKPNNPDKNIKFEVTENYDKSPDHHVTLLVATKRANLFYRLIATGEEYEGELVSMWWDQNFGTTVNLQSFGVNLAIRSPSINVTAMDYNPIDLPAGWFPEIYKTNPELLPIWGLGGRSG